MGMQMGWAIALAGVLVPCLAAEGWAQEWTRSDGGMGGGYGTARVGRETSLRFSIGTAFFIQGAVSEDATNPPDYSDAFGPAFGAFVELDSRLSREFSVHGGVGYVQHQGDTTQGIDFDAWSLMPFFVGAKFHPTVGASADTDVYFRLDVGGAQSQPVDISQTIPFFGTIKADFYESDTLFLFGAGVGIAFRPQGSRIRIFGEIGYRGLTGPGVKNSGDRGELSGAITIEAGVAFLV